VSEARWEELLSYGSILKMGSSIYKCLEIDEYGLFAEFSHDFSVERVS
jgi:hypothetical protein